MKFQVNKQNIELTDATMSLISGTTNYKAEFTFSDDWDGFTKTAVFLISTGETELGILVDDVCGIPSAVITENCYFRLGVYGMNGDEKLPTVWTETIRVQEGCSEVIDTVELPDGFVNQVIALMTASKNAAEASAQSASDAESIAEGIRQQALDGDFTATVEVGNVLTGAPGTNVEITNSGTAQHAVFNFTIPKGAKGDQGYQGPQGTTAYQYAVAGGYTGTEIQFQSSIANAANAVPITNAEVDAIVDSIWEEV